MEGQGEIRRNPVSGATVIFPAKRQKSLEELRRQGQRNWPNLKPGVLEGDSCPFCPGHEESTPPEIRAYRMAETSANQPGWWVRVVFNKASAVDFGAPSERLEETITGPYFRLPAFGKHFVIVEMPEHEGSLAATSPHQVREVLSMWRDLTGQVGSERHIRHCFFFENYGPLAGASQPHPHSQLIALPMVPKRITDEFSGARRYWDDSIRCFYCREIEWEIDIKERIVKETDNFLAWCPFASPTPYIVVIAPKEHQSCFGNISTDPWGRDHLTEYSSLVQEILQRSKTVLNDPDYSFYLHMAPSTQPETLFYHWHSLLEPITTAIPAGFEKGSGTYINPRLPEDAAEDLRNASI